jgi:hypothetical protein
MVLKEIDFVDTTLRDPEQKRGIHELNFGSTPAPTLTFCEAGFNLDL